MKRILISLGLGLASTMVLAGGVDVPTVTADSTYYPCTNAASTKNKASIWGGSGAVVTGTIAFTRTGFDVQCSANVDLGIQETTTFAAVASSSSKGNQYFAGHSNGGAISAVNKCAATACTQTDVNSGITKAKTDATATGS